MVTSEKIQSLDIAIAGGRIAGLAQGLDRDAEVSFDASGGFVFPGFIDDHVHFNEPGRASWEGLETGSWSRAEARPTSICL